jgi:azurin
VRNNKLLNQLLRSPEPHARVAAQTVQHHWFSVDHKRGGGGDETDPLSEVQEKSGVLSDTPELTTVRVGTIIEKMRFDLKEFQVKAGKKIELTFANTDFLPHNLVITLPKSADEVALAAMAMGADGFAKGYVPDHEKILVASKLLDHEQEEILEFNAPEKPGDYEFVCTFPGHHLLMRGIMKVVK